MGPRRRYAANLTDKPQNLYTRPVFYALVGEDSVEIYIMFSTGKTWTIGLQKCDDKLSRSDIIPKRDWQTELLYEYRASALSIVVPMGDKNWV